MKIGFIGLGRMGSGMAQNLLKAGYQMTVFDAQPENCKPFVAEGAMAPSTVKDLARCVDIVFTSLPGPKEMQDIAMRDDGLFSNMREGTVWFDLTTNSPTVLKQIGKQFAERHITLLDAPVSGGPGGAKSGKLAIYVGGDRVAFEKYKPVLDAIGDQVMYVGALGAATAAKLVHNTASFVTRMVIAEVFALGVKAGVEPLELWHAIRMGAIGRARTFDVIGDHYLQSKYDPASFALRLAHKDLTLGLDLARDLNVPMKYTQAAFEDYEAALERGWHDRDSRSPMELVNERAGVQIKESAEDVKRTLARG
jgi:3-hydroxyisobutyrate dehydrogenase